MQNIFLAVRLRLHNFLKVLTAYGFRAVLVNEHGCSPIRCESKDFGFIVGLYLFSSRTARNTVS